MDEQSENNEVRASETETEVTQRPAPMIGLLKHWRWFAMEFSVVALGVLTALGLEQAISSFREQQRVELAREAVEEELRLNVAKATLLLQSVDCQRTQLEFLQGSVGAGDTDNVRELLSIVELAPGTTWNDSAWQSAISSGLSDYFEPEDRLYLPIIYEILGEIKTRNLEFVVAQDRLVALAGSELAMSEAAPDAMLVEMLDMTAALESSPALLEAFINLARNPIGIEVDPENPGTGQFQVLQTSCPAAAAALSQSVGG